MFFGAVKTAYTEEHRPDNLKSAINAGPPYFRYDGKWMGSPSTTSLMGSVPVENLDDAATVLARLNPASVRVMFQAREDFIAGAKERRKIEEAKAAALSDLWVNRLKTPLEIGEKICTYETNLFGYVDGIQNNKVRMLVRGQVDMDRQIPGYFFNVMFGKASYTPIDAIRWIDRSGVAHCSFGD